MNDLLFHYWPAVPLTENNSLFWTIERCVNQLSIILQKKNSKETCFAVSHNKFLLQRAAELAPFSSRSDDR